MTCELAQRLHSVTLPPVDDPRKASLESEGERETDKQTHTHTHPPEQEGAENSECKARGAGSEGHAL